MTKWKPFDRPLSPSELNYRHRAEQPSDFELDRIGTDPGVGQLLQRQSDEVQRPKSRSPEWWRSDADKSPEEAWLLQRGGCNQELP